VTDHADLLDEEIVYPEIVIAAEEVHPDALVDETAQFGKAPEEFLGQAVLVFEAEVPEVADDVCIGPSIGPPSFWGKGRRCPLSRTFPADWNIALDLDGSPG
jgi:hypothetical protein